MDTCEDFVADLVRINFLRIAKEEAIKEWDADIPTTLLFATFGKVIAERFDEFLLKERFFVFDRVEAGMRSSDTMLKTLIATGLLEALFSQCTSDIDLWKRIDAQLGDASRDYLIEWGRLYK
jgi:hypothetical protein